MPSGKMVNPHIKTDARPLLLRTDTAICCGAQFMPRRLNPVGIVKSLRRFLINPSKAYNSVFVMGCIKKAGISQMKKALTAN